MAQYQVITDPALEFAVIVNMDTGEALPPVAAGPQAKAFLEAFLTDSEGYLEHMSNLGIMDAWQGFLKRIQTPDTVEPVTPATDQVESTPGPDVDAAARMAEAVAAGTTDTPPPAPHDTDPTADQTPTAVMVPCFNCNGTRMISMGEGEPAQVCNVCQGTGQIAQVQ